MNERLLLPKAMAPLRHSGYLLLWSTSLLMSLAIWCQNIAATWWMISAQGSPGMIASIPLALAAPGIVLSIASGVICDILGWRLVLLWAGVIVSASALLLVALNGQSLLDPMVLVLLSALLGCGAAIRQPAQQASFGTLVPANLLLEAIALDSLNVNLGRCLGPAFGGILVAAGGIRLGFEAGLVLSLPTLIAIRYLPAATGNARRARSSFWFLLNEGIRYCFGDKVLRSIYVLIFAFGICGQSLWVLIPISFATERLGNSMLYGAVLSFIGAGAVVGAALRSTLQRMLVHEKAIPAALAVAGAAPLSVYLHVPLAAQCAALFCFGMAWTTIFSTANFVVQTVAPAAAKGRALSYYLASMYLGWASGSWLWGAAAGAIGVRQAAVFVTFGMCLLCGWALNHLLPVIRGAMSVRAVA
jgi:MFS family permease